MRRDQMHAMPPRRVQHLVGNADVAHPAQALTHRPFGGRQIHAVIIIDTRTSAMTGSTATANIYFGTAGVSGTQSTIVQLAQGFLRVAPGVASSDGRRYIRTQCPRAPASSSTWATCRSR